MITFRHNAWILGTPETTYIFRKTETGHLEHLYYGPAIAHAESLGENDLAAMSVRRVFPAGNTISYDADHPASIYIYPKNFDAKKLISFDVVYFRI